MTITVTGGVTFSPATIGGAVSFNGTTQNLTVPATFTNATSTTPFTWEVWVYPTANYNGGAIFTGTYAPSVIPFALGGFQGDNSTINFGYYSGSAWVGTNSGVTLTLNTWSHVAAVFSGTVLTLYVNGSSIATLTTSWTTTAGTSPFLIGRRWDNSGTSRFFSGYITNLRYVAGTAVYTSNFTPPTSPLTITQSANLNGNPSAAITGTKTNLLLNVLSSSAYLTDGSTNNFTVTPVSSPTFTSLSPITTNFFNGGAVSFNGSTQELDISAISTITGTGTFTIEAWVYPLNYSDETSISGSGDSNLQIFRLNENGSGSAPSGISVYDNGTQVFQNVGAGTYPVANKWTHLAWVKNGTTNTLYINGISSATYTGNVPNFTPNVIGVFYYLGEANSAWFNGYITNYRVVNGVAVYTSNFTTPTSPLTATQSANVNGNPSAAITGTQTAVLLDVLSSSAYLTDSSTNNLTVTPVNSPPFISSSPISPSYITFSPGP